MKKLILIIVILSTTVNYSQSKKNNKKLIQSKQVSKFEMGLSAGFDFQKGVNDLSRSFALTNLYTGYFINPKTEIGLKISKSFIKEADNFGFGIFGRRYFNNFYGGLGYNRTNYTFQNTDVLGTNLKPIKA